jgi:hypothetical protein
MWNPNLAAESCFADTPHAPHVDLMLLSSTIFHLEGANHHHWPTSLDKWINCHVCFARDKRKTIKCQKRDVGLWILRCFKGATQKRDLVILRSDETYTHMKQITKKGYVHCILLHLKVNICECAAAPLAVCALPLVACPSAQIYVLRLLHPYLSVHKYMHFRC